MIEDLLSLRVVVATRDESLANLFQQAALVSTVPVELAEIADAATAQQTLEGADIAYIDGALKPQEIAEIYSALRATSKRPFSILLATASTAGKTFPTDGLAGKPSRIEESQWLLERSMRVRVPSRALVVDDSSTMRMIVRRTLAATRFQFQITEATEGLAALELVRNGEFDIVFLDYNMPGYSGLETLAEFKREKSRVSVVMITSADEEALAERVRALGAAFLKKPFFPADIENALCGHYGLRALNPSRP